MSRTQLEEKKDFDFVLKIVSFVGLSELSWSKFCLFCASSSPIVILALHLVVNIWALRFEPGLGYWIMLDWFVFWWTWKLKLYVHCFCLNSHMTFMALVIVMELEIKDHVGKYCFVSIYSFYILKFYEKFSHCIKHFCILDLLFRVHWTKFVLLYRKCNGFLI